MHEEEIKKQIIAGIESANIKLGGKYTITFDENIVKVINIPSIDKFEDAVPFHNAEACRTYWMNKEWCSCRFCRTWCHCMQWWRDKQKEDEIADKLVIGRK